VAVNIAAAHTGTGPSGAEVRVALQGVLASTLFCKAPQARRLLSYLVEQAQAGTARLTNEYAIGIAVFGRDGASYSTGEDPIVRVHAGRLRERLQRYYTGVGRHDPVRIHLSPGNYLARFDYARAAALTPRLAFEPLVCIDTESRAHAFTLGLNAELGHRLYCELSGRLVGAQGEQASHVLGGSVRCDGCHWRLFLNLANHASGSIACSERIDHAGDGSLASHEQLAVRCYAALRPHLCAAGIALR
jgi:hypothetical protein